MTSDDFLDDILTISKGESRAAEHARTIVVHLRSILAKFETRVERGSVQAFGRLQRNTINDAIGIQRELALLIDLDEEETIDILQRLLSKSNFVYAISYWPESLEWFTTQINPMGAYPDEFQENLNRMLEIAPLLLQTVSKAIHKISNKDPNAVQKILTKKIMMSVHNIIMYETYARTDFYAEWRFLNPYTIDTLPHCTIDFLEEFKDDEFVKEFLVKNKFLFNVLAWSQRDRYLPEPVMDLGINRERGARMLDKIFEILGQERSIETITHKWNHIVVDNNCDCSDLSLSLIQRCYLPVTMGTFGSPWIGGIQPSTTWHPEGILTMLTRLKDAEQDQIYEALTFTFNVEYEDIYGVEHQKDETWSVLCGAVNAFDIRFVRALPEKLPGTSLLGLIRDTNCGAENLQTLIDRKVSERPDSGALLEIKKMLFSKPTKSGRKPSEPRAGAGGDGGLRHRREPGDGAGGGPLVPGNLH